MVDKRLIIIVLLTLLLLTGCGKKANNTYTINSNNDTYVNGNSTSTTTTTTTTKEPITTTTRETTTVKRIAYVSEDNRGPSTNEVLDEAKNNVSIYINDINAMIDSINRYRASEGLKPLKYDYHLSVAASVRATEMSHTRVFEHVRQCVDNNPNKDCRKWSTVYSDLGIKYNRAAENIAYGFNDIEKSMVAFMNSPTHRKNIMNPNLVYIGIGIAPINGTYYYAQEFRA
jgi:uncharacterized protein YkwD